MHRFSNILLKDLEKAAEFLDQNGLDQNSIHNYYYIQLKNGREYPFKQLTHKAYELVHGSSKDLNFQRDENNEKIVEGLGVKVKYYSENINPFQEHELEVFNKLSGKKYRKESKESKTDSNRLLPLIKKLNYWAKRLENFGLVSHQDNKWLWPGGKIREYLWIRLFNPNDSGKIFFDIGIDGNGDLYLDLNPRTSILRGKSSISSFEKVIYDDFIKSNNFQPLRINKTNKKGLKWNNLIELSKSFILSNYHLYLELEVLLNQNFEFSSKNTVSNISNSPSPPPKIITSYINTDPSFKGHKTDWIKSNNTSSYIGNKGEKFIEKIEKEHLIKNGRSDLAENVGKVLDGKGYDILSFEPDGTEKYIEVKTTLGEASTPFQITINEKRFLELNPFQSMIYRVYNFVPHKLQGHYYIIKPDEFDNYLLKPKVFEVSK